jgi:hypothetical protein
MIQTDIDALKVKIQKELEHSGKTYKPKPYEAGWKMSDMPVREEKILYRILKKLKKEYPELSTGQLAHLISNEMTKI